MEAIKTTIEEAMEQSSAMMVRMAERMTIQSQEDFERGNTILKDIKVHMKQVKDYWKEPKKQAQEAHKTLVARESEMLKSLEIAESIIKKAMLAYHNCHREGAKGGRGSRPTTAAGGGPEA